MNVESDYSVAEIMDSAKKYFNDGKNMIQRVINTEDSMRNLKHLSKENLEKVVRLSVMNSLMITKILMFGDKAVLKINKANSVYCLPAFDVEKKQ